MIFDFFNAVLPWIAIAVAIAYIMAFWAKKSINEDTDK